MPKDIASTADLKEMLANHKRVIVGFHAPWSEPCKTIVPMFEGMEPEFPDLTFVKVNVDTLSDIQKVPDAVPDVPAFVAYFGGKDFGIIHGTNVNNLRELLEGLQGAADDDDD
ncbi:hypothetical protein BGW42_004903 [Actinomortierella wolfii]|nr:hypothetical protein BGW42_004903 [Actinomortierella wolfii]